MDETDKVPRNPKAALPVLAIWAVLILGVIYWQDLQGISLMLFVLLTASYDLFGR